MPDEPKKTEAPKSSEQGSSREERIQHVWGLLKEFKKEITISGGLSLVLWLVYQVSRNPDARGLLRELKEGVISVAGDLGIDKTEIAKNEVRLYKAWRSIQYATNVIGLVVLSLSYILIEMSTMIHHGAVRAATMLPVGLAVSLFSLWYAKNWIMPVAAITAAMRLIPGEKAQVTFAEKAARVLAKFNGWYHFGLNVAIIAPFHNAPQLAWMALGLNLNYVWFCNGWRRGESEHTRRSILWMTAAAQGIMVLLSPYPNAVKWVMTAPKTWQDPHFYVVAIAFALIAAITLFLGTRPTHEDKAFALVRVTEAFDGKDLAKIAEAGRLVGLVDDQDESRPRSGARRTMGSRIYKQPRPMLPIIAVLLAVLVMVGLSLVINASARAYPTAATATFQVPVDFTQHNLLAKH